MRRLRLERLERLEGPAPAGSGREAGAEEALEARAWVGHACGKVILLGEHAVVYGIPAIAVGIDCGARARAAPLEAGPSRLHVCGWNIRVDEAAGPRAPSPDLGGAFRALLDAVRADAPSLGPQSVEVEANLPPGGGLGCSAAMGVAIARAVDPGVSHDAVQKRAMAWERVFHGNPSGIDAAVAARGGCVFFKRANGLERVSARGTLHLCIGSSGSASSTKSMVDAVAELRVRRPDVVAQSFESVGTLVESARVAIEEGDTFEVGRLMSLNQLLLGGLLVSTPEIERMCSLARGAGALGAKLTGAGGGGSVVALVSSETASEAVLAAWQREGFEGFATSVAPETRARPPESEALGETSRETAP